MREEVEELNEPSDGHGLVLLGSEEGLLQVDVFDDLQSNKLGHVHDWGLPTCRRGLCKFPPVLTEQRRVLILLQTLMQT